MSDTPCRQSESFYVIGGISYLASSILTIVALSRTSWLDIPTSVDFTWKYFFVFMLVLLILFWVVGGVCLCQITQNWREQRSPHTLVSTRLTLLLLLIISTALYITMFIIVAFGLQGVQDDSAPAVIWARRAMLFMMLWNWLFTILALKWNPLKINVSWMNLDNGDDCMD